MFTYGEAETPSPKNLDIENYICYLHSSKIDSTANFRRGLAIFYLEKYRYSFTKVYACRKYDIVWMRLKTACEIIHFCFFYAPGSHHPLPARTKFYDHFSSQFSKFASLGKVYLIGDTNARLGSLLDDRNFRGQLTSNANKPLFLEFLEYTGSVILNSKYLRGVPTYEIFNKKRSIIDLCLTNSPDSVFNFEIASTPFGVNSQTCHKALTLTIGINALRRTTSSAPRRTKFGRITSKKQNKIFLEVTGKICRLNHFGVSPDYFLLTKFFYTAKLKILGNGQKKRKAARLSSAILNLQKRFSNAVANMKREKSQLSIFIVGYLEKLLNAQHKREKDFNFDVWIRKMNDLDYQNRTRTFYSEIRKRYCTREEPGPICDEHGTISDNVDDTLKNWSQYYKNLYSSKQKKNQFPNFPTPDEDPDLDKDLTHAEFVDIIYSLKNHKSPGFDHILNEDITSSIIDLEENDAPPSQKNALLAYIFKILTDYWFNERVPPDFKRTILRPFLKDKEKKQSRPL